MGSWDSAPLHSGTMTPGVFTCKSEFLAVLMYSKNVHGRTGTETGTTRYYFLSSVNIFGGRRGFRLFWVWEIDSHH